MKALLDTNIVIHREATTVVNQSIGTLFKWLAKAKYDVCVHPITIQELQKHRNQRKLESLNIKLQSYNLLKTIAPLANEVCSVSQDLDVNINDQNDSKLLNEVFQGRVDLFISEDKKIHRKAGILGIEDKVYNIDGFLEKIVSENPELINYDVLSVTKSYFGDINLCDTFFDSFREDYSGFDRWFNKKADETAYVTHNNGRILSFLYLKLEDEKENYSEVSPAFAPKRRLKIGTFKVVSNGVRLGERFLKIIFDNALANKVNEIYLTIFDKTEEQKRLIELLIDWGFVHHGIKRTQSGEELVYVRNFEPEFIQENPKHSFPYISESNRIFLCPIYSQYHTNLFPDSILRTESPLDFKESQPHRNAIRKVYISRSYERNLNSGDVIVFYMAAGQGGYYRSVVTTIGMVESVIDGLKDENEFILRCRKRSVFSEAELREHWNYQKGNRPFIVNFLYTYSLPKRLNMAKLIELGVIADSSSAPRGFTPISREQFYRIIKGSQSNESLIVH